MTGNCVKRGAPQVPGRLEPPFGSYSPPNTICYFAGLRKFSDRRFFFFQVFKSGVTRVQWVEKRRPDLQIWELFFFPSHRSFGTWKIFNFFSFLQVFKSGVTRVQWVEKRRPDLQIWELFFFFPTELFCE